jgi:ribosomal protein S18 acetylase RimI-like enzyme
LLGSQVVKSILSDVGAYFPSSSWIERTLFAGHDSKAIVLFLRSCYHSLAIINIINTMSSANVRIEVVEERHIEELARVRRSFLNSKHFCCCLPLGLDSEAEIRKGYKKCPELMQVAAVAIVPEMGVVGYIQLVLEGMPCDTHKVKAGEAYVYMLTVDPEARGKGVGTALLKWADGVGKNRDCTFMSLEVIHGNKAIGLYEREGYVVKPASLFSRIIMTIPLCLIIGPVICISGAPNYCSYGQAHYMEKILE